jgi:hypothetical protein
LEGKGHAKGSLASRNGISSDLPWNKSVKRVILIRLNTEVRSNGSLTRMLISFNIHVIGVTCLDILVKEIKAIDMILIRLICELYRKVITEILLKVVLNTINS